MSKKVRRIVKTLDEATVFTKYGDASRGLLWSERAGAIPNGERTTILEVRINVIGVGQKLK